MRICLCVFIILLSIRYNVRVCHSPVYHYITATAVYFTQRFTTTCVDDIVCIYRMNSLVVACNMCTAVSRRVLVERAVLGEILMVWTIMSTWCFAWHVHVSYLGTSLC